MERFNEQFQKGFSRISPEAEAFILAYDWPGNVRELRNTVERIILLERGDAILPKHLTFLCSPAGENPQAHSFKPVIPPQGIVLDAVMKEYLQEALRMKKGNKIQAAKLLGISRSALIYRMEKYKIKDN